MIQKEKTETTKFVAIKVSGDAVLNLWGGGQGTIEMQPFLLKPEKATKDNILRCVNDNGFGCESIHKAFLNVEAVYDNGSTELLRSYWEINHPIHTRLFNGWGVLNDQGAYYRTRDIQ